MSVFYRLHQDQSTGTKRSGKWYARAVPTAVISTRQLAEIVQGARRGHEGPDAGLQAREAGRLRFVQDRHRVEGCCYRCQVRRGRAHQGSARGVHA